MRYQAEARGIGISLITVQGTVIALPGASPVGSGPSLSRSGGSEDVVRDGTATPRPLAAGEHPAVAGLPPRFPPPPRVALTGPFGVHRGPATSSSLTGSPIPTRLNPLAPVYYPNMAAAMLARGAPPGTRDPMDIPFDPAAGYTPVHPAAVAGLMNSAAHHAAMVFKRLIAADSVIFANELDAHFTRILGREYQEAVVRVIAEGSDNGTVESSSTADSNA